MADFHIVRTNLQMVSGPGLEWVRQFIFRCFRGQTVDDNRGWRLLWKKMFAMEAGEILHVTMTFERHRPSHKGYMKFEAELFDKQERFEYRSVFRDWLKVGAGFVTWAPGATGGTVPIPRELSFAKADESDFRQYVANALVFVRGEHCQKYLWPHLTAGARSEMVEFHIKGYERFLERFQ